MLVSPGKAVWCWRLVSRHCPQDNPGQQGNADLAPSLQALKSWQFVLLLIWAGSNTLCGCPDTVWDLGQILIKWKTKPYRGEILSFPIHWLQRKLNSQKPNCELCEESGCLSEMTKRRTLSVAGSALLQCQVLRKYWKAESQVMGIQVMPTMET